MRKVTLAERRAELIARSAAEREAATIAAGGIRASLAGVDRTLGRVQRWPLRPIAIALAIAGATGAVLLRGRLPGLRSAGVLLGWTAAALRVGRLLGTLQGARARHPGAPLRTPESRA
jgi:hypothetical protein